MASRPRPGAKRPGHDATRQESAPPDPAKQNRKGRGAGEGGEYKINLTDHKPRSDRAWTDRDVFQKFYDDAYDFAIPYRRPADRVGKGANRIEKLFDSTAIESAFRAAGQLHQDLFPPGFWKLTLGAVAKAAVKAGSYPKQQADADKAELERITDIASAFFGDEFDISSSETCIDLQVGTGCLFPLEGDDDNPIRWLCIPFDQLAIEVDAYGKVVGIFWKQKLTQRQIKNAFKDGVFPDTFTRKDNTPDEEMELRQDFILDPETKRWTFCAWLADSAVPIDEAEYKTQPMAIGRYHRVPGEPYGRGPILLALPTIKTVNKAVELTLKAAAIQMLGIWGFRPGGSFNPDTVRLGPGEFWPMQATAGVLGPDVTRLDAAAGRIDVGNLVTQELRQQIQSMLGDDKLPADGATPRSATEIMARMKRISQNYLGAYGRLVNEIIPVIVRRVIEILYRRRIIVSKVDIAAKLDNLLIKVDVLSPIAAAVKAAAHQRIIEFFQLCVAVKGDPIAADLIIKVDDALRAIGEEQIPNSLIRTEDEQKTLERLIQTAAAKIVAAQQKQTAATKQPAPAGA